MRTVNRRGVLKVSAGPSGTSRCSFSCCSTILPSWFVRSGSQLAGISSQPISSSSSRSTSDAFGCGNSACRVRLLHIALGDPDRQLTHTQDIRRSLGHADAVAGIKNVEKMRALEAVLERRPDQTRLQQRLGEAVVVVEQPSME